MAWSTATTIRDGNPSRAHRLEKKLCAVNQELFGAPMTVSAVHAGLECGNIGAKYSGMEMISFGPTIEGAHNSRRNMWDSPR